MTEPNYSYKYCPPDPFINAVRRHRLFSELELNENYSVVVIQGPAGHGKTTLMQQLYQTRQESGALVSWLTLDDSDNDISRFNSSLRTLVTNAVGDAEQIELPEKERQGAGAVENILYLLESLKKPVALFLDEFQVINQQVNLNLLYSILERSPARIKFYIGTRSIPKLVQGRLMISGRLKYITSEELRFSTDEVRSFLDNAGLKVSEAEAATFREKTEGWPAILQLLNLALRAKKVNRDNLLVWVKGCPSELRSYLAENVMSGQNTEVQNFLLSTSPLRRLSAELCETVTGIAGGRDTLELLVDQGMFLRSMDGHKQWFKYHSVFSEYLRSQLVLRYEGKETEIHQRAADWFLENELLEEAIYHAIEAKEYDLAADTLEEFSEELIRNARLGTLESLCSSLPDTVFEARPTLYLSYAWALMFNNSHQKAQQLTKKLEAISPAELRSRGIELSTRILKCVADIAYDHFEDSLSQIDKISIELEAEMSKFRHFEYGAFSNVKAINSIQSGNLVAAREFSIMGESLGATGDAAFSGAYSSSLLGLTMVLGGELGIARKHLNASLSARALKIQGSLAAASLSAVYGYALYESGDYAEAESHLRDAIDMISQSLPTDWQILAHIALARSSAMEESENSDSIEILDNAEKLALTNRRPRLFRAIKRERIRMALLNEDVNTAETLAAMSDLMVTEPALPDGWIHLAENTSDETIGDIRLEIHCGDAATALKKLVLAKKQAFESGRVLRVMKTLILSALANKALGKVDIALAQMHEAVLIAAPQHYVSVFLEEGQRCFELLTDLVNKSSNLLEAETLSFVSELLPDSVAVKSTGALGSAEQPAVGMLTDKERAVLALVTDGYSNKEIADQLFVSYNTIKFHMKNIFSKLAVKNRIDLVRYSRSHGLL